MSALSPSVHLAELAERQARGGFASEHLAAHFRTHRQLGPKDKEEISRLFYALVRATRRLDFAFENDRLAAGPTARTEFFLHVQGRLDENWLHRAHPAVDWARVHRRYDTIEGVTHPFERWAIESNLTKAVAEQLEAALGPELAAFLEAIGRPAPRTLRSNRLKGTRAELETKLEAEGFRVRATRFAADGLSVTAGGDLFQCAAFRDGWFEVQDEGSQLIAELVAPPPAGLVIDACAGAGGKTLALASLMGGRGRVVALDIHEHKLETLRQRARRAGASNVEAIRIEPEGPLPERVLEQLGRADRILVDAPCSGLGVLRRNPEAGARLDAEDLARLPSLQRAIVRRFAAHLKPGARLVYSTCTLLPAENEVTVAELLRESPELQPVRVSEIMGGDRAAPLSPDGGVVMKLRPDLHSTDGFFAAVVRRPRA